MKPLLEILCVVEFVIILILLSRQIKLDDEMTRLKIIARVCEQEPTYGIKLNSVEGGVVSNNSIKDNVVEPPK